MCWPIDSAENNLILWARTRASTKYNELIGEAANLLRFIRSRAILYNILASV